MVVNKRMNIYEEILYQVYGYKLDDLNEKNSKNIKECIVELRKSYRNDTPITKYSQDDIRKAYMLAYYPNYAKLAYDITSKYILKHIDLEVLGKALNIVFWGAGPAAEVYGFCKALDNLKLNKRVRISISDLEKQWKEQREITKKLLRNLENIKASNFKDLSGCDLTYNCKNICFNWTSCEKTTFNSDIYFMQNCINHMSSDIKLYHNLFKRIELMKKGALFVIIDLNYENVKDTVHKLIDKSSNIADLIEGNIEFAPNISRFNYEIPDNAKKYIFTSENFLYPKKNTNYYFVVLKRR